MNKKYETLENLTTEETPIRKLCKSFFSLILSIEDIYLYLQDILNRIEKYKRIESHVLSEMKSLYYKTTNFWNFVGNITIQSRPRLKDYADKYRMFSEIPNIEKIILPIVTGIAKFPRNRYINDDEFDLLFGRLARDIMNIINLTGDYKLISDTKDPNTVSYCFKEFCDLTLMQFIKTENAEDVYINEIITRFCDNYDVYSDDKTLLNGVLTKLTVIDFIVMIAVLSSYLIYDDILSKLTGWYEEVEKNKHVGLRVIQFNENEEDKKVKIGEPVVWT